MLTDLVYWSINLDLNSVLLLLFFFTTSRFILAWRCSFYSRLTPALRHECLGAAVYILHLGTRWSWRSFSGFPPGHNPRHSRSCSCFESGDANILWALDGYIQEVTDQSLALPIPSQQQITWRVIMQYRLTRIGVSLLCPLIRRAIKLAVVIMVGYQCYHQ
jgi:hypothetical protein